MTLNDKRLEENFEYYYKEQDIKQFTREILEEIDNRLKEIESAIKGGVNFKLKNKGKNVSATLKTLRFSYNELNKIKEIIKQKAE